MNTLCDIEQHISFLKSRENRLDYYTRFSSSPHIIEKKLCKSKLQDYEKSKELVLSFEELKFYISDNNLKELINIIWDDVETTCPWGNRQKIKLQRLKNNIIIAKHYEQFYNSRFYKLLNNKFTL